MDKLNPENTNYYWTYLLFLVFAVIPGTVSGQDYVVNIQHWGVKDGLIHREVNALHQDSDGFVWLGTPFGLNRFDGYSFRWWTSGKDSLNVRKVFLIKEDVYGDLWLFNKFDRGPGFKAIDLFSPTENRVIAFEEYFKEQIDFSILDLSSQVVQMNNGLIAMTKIEGNQVILADQKKGVSYIDLPAEKIILVTSTHRSTLWCLVNRNSLVEVDLDGNILRRFSHQKNISADFIRLPDKAPLFLYWTNNTSKQAENIYILDCITGQRTQVNEETFPGLRWDDHDEDMNTVNVIPGKGWLIFNYTQVYDQEGQQILDLQPYFSKAEPKISFRDILFDRKGRLWVGGSFGFHAIEVTENKFDNYLTNDDVGWSDFHALRGISTSNGQLYASGEYNGLYKVDLNKNKQEKLTGFPYPTIFLATVTDESGKIWNGISNGLFIYDPDTGESREIEMPGVFPWEIYFSESDKVLLGSHNNLYVLDRETSEWYTFEGKNEFSSFKGTVVYHIAKDKEGRLWAATGNGLYQFNLEEGIKEKYSSEPGATSFLPAIDIQHFHIDSSGIFWIATRGDGLIKFDPTNGDHQQFTRDHGLANNVLYAVYEDEKGFLWLPSDYGLIRFQKSTGNSWSYSTKNGIPNNEFNRISHHQDEKGRLYFGTINGLISFNPSDFWGADSIAQAPIAITQYLRYNRTEGKLDTLTSEIVQNNKVILHPYNDFFILNFSLLEFEEPDKVNYAYMVEGQHDEWINLEEGQLRLNNFPYGDFKLKIIGQSSTGRWSKEPLTLDLIIIPPLFQQIWFQIVVTVLILGFFIFIIYTRSRIQKAQQQKLEKIIEERTEQIRKDKQIIEQQAEGLKELDKTKTRFFDNISHELRTPLTLIIEPIRQLYTNSRDIVLRQKLKGPLQNSQKLLDLINQMLDLSKVENEKMELELRWVKIDDSLTQVCQHFSPLAKSKRINFIIENSQQVPFAYWDIQKMEQIVNNLLSNAFKFTEEGGTVLFSIFYDQEHHQLELQCADTGIGIEASQRDKVFDRFYQVDNSITKKQDGSGIGLALVNELTTLMGGKVSLESEPGKGAVFNLTFPFNTELPDEYLTKMEGGDEKVTPVPLADIEEGEGPLPFGQQKEVTGNGAEYKILIVEDNEELRKFIRESLPKQYEVVEASNGKEGVDLSRAHIPDLVIGDVMMPEMDGYEMCKRIKRDPLTSHIPVVMLTAKSSQDSKIYGYQTGAEAYLTKPFHTEELVIRVEKLIETRRILQEKYSQMKTMVHKQDLKELSQVDIEFMERVNDQIRENLDNEDFNVEFLAKGVYMSRSQLFRKFKALLGKSPVVYIRESRLQEAMNILQEEKITLLALASKVGFKDERYFSTKFKELFGISPAEVHKI